MKFTCEIVGAQFVTSRAVAVEAMIVAVVSLESERNGRGVRRQDLSSLRERGRNFGGLLLVGHTMTHGCAIWGLEPIFVVGT